MNIAVTGASGFLGTHVVAELASLSVPVTRVVRPASQGATKLVNHGVVYLDLRDPPPNAYELMGCPDVLIHLGWGGVSDCRLLSHFEEELPAQYSFLKGLVLAGLAKLVVTGTCFEYGMQSGPLTEDMECRPSNPYGLAKDTLRRQLQCLRASCPFALTWARLFYLHGEGQAEGSLFPQLKRAVERGDNVFRMSCGEQLRDYMSAADAARLLVSLALNGRGDDIVNICSGVPVSVRRLVEGWVEENGWSITLDLGYYPYRDSEAMAFWGVRDKLDRCQDLDSRDLTRAIEGDNS